MAALVRADRRFDGVDILPLADPEAGALLAELPPEVRMSSLQLLDADGSVHSAGAAVAELLRRHRAGAWVPWLTDRSPLALRGVEGVYRLVAANRGRLSRLVADTAPVRRRRAGPGG